MHFKPTYAGNACPWLCRRQVAAVPCNVSKLLIMLVLGSLGCEWLLCIQCFKMLMMPDLGSLGCECCNALVYF